MSAVRKLRIIAVAAMRLAYAREALWDVGMFGDDDVRPRRVLPTPFAQQVAPVRPNGVGYGGTWSRDVRPGESPGAILKPAREHVFGPTTKSLIMKNAKCEQDWAFSPRTRAYFKKCK